MVNPTPKTIAPVVMLILTVLSATFLFAASAQMTGGETCDSCGMTLDATAQARYRIVDKAGHQYYACCPVCALKLIKTYGELNITTFCDYQGPDYPITIVSKNHGSSLTVNPQTAMIILGGSCLKNRLVYSSQAADIMLSNQNNGTSNWLSPTFNVTVASNSTRLGLAQAVLQYGGGESMPCEACGMTVDTIGQARCKILDANGIVHVACCPICALKLLKTYGALNYTMTCDYNGPSQIVSVIAKNYGADVTVTPSTALVIIGGSCTKNRVVVDSSSADALLAAPNFGTSRWLPSTNNDTVASNATRLTLTQAALQYGGSQTSTPTPTATATPTTSTNPTSSPSLTSSPTSTQSPTPIVTIDPQLTNQECEACGMIVNAESQAKYKVVDGNGQIHYVECVMCALQLVNKYDQLTISTFCDWYGPNYPITVQSRNFGKEVTVTPSTAMFLNGGSCVINRAAYNQTAADQLLTNGYSNYTLSNQQYSLPTETKVSTMADAVLAIGQRTPNQPSNLPVILAAVAGVAIIAGSIGAYMKLRVKKS